MFLLVYFAPGKKIVTDGFQLTYGESEWNSDLTFKKFFYNIWKFSYYFKNMIMHW